MDTRRRWGRDNASPQSRICAAQRVGRGWFHASFQIAQLPGSCLTCNDVVVVMKSRIACALAAAAVAVSACSTGVSGSAVPSSELITQKAATTTGEASTQVPGYVDVTGQGTVTLDHQREQYGNPAPGVKIGRVSSSDPSGSAKCTLGPAVTAAGRKGFLTAGHCADKPGTDQYAQVNYDGSDPLLLGPAVQAQDAPAPGGYSDSAVIWTASVDPGATRIAGRWPVSGVMPAREVRALPAGTPVCIDGAKSGVVCSRLVSANGDYILTAPMTQPGDSGSAVFVIDDKSNLATLIGIHRGTANEHSEATFLEPALHRFGATALTASA